ncbi:hypothetical protein HHI36_000402, partial [Cryptolaemus montrouzieri]
MECGSDHHFIKAKIYFAQYTHMIPPTQEITDEERQCKPKRYQSNLLQAPSVAFLYKLRLSQKLTQIDDFTATKLYDILVKSIHQAAGESLGELNNGRNKKSLYWWNDSIKESIEEKKRAYNKWLTIEDSEDKKILHNLRTNEYRRTSLQPISMSEWELYYKQQMKEDRVQFDRTELELNEQNTEITKITPQEVKTHICSQKNGRSPGPGQVNVELLKSGPDILFEWLTHLFHRCLSGEQLPEDFRKG